MKSTLRRLLSTSAAVALATTTVSAAAMADAPRVVASIKPIHSLVAGVMEGIAEPDYIVGGAGSPHTYQMRPSEAQSLDEAEIVFWVGPGLETFLERPLDSLAEDATVVALMEAPDLRLVETREGGSWDAHSHDHGHDHDHGDDHDDHGHDDHGHNDHHEGVDLHSTDAHIWLGPDNARGMLGMIADVLADHDPDNAEAYRDNAEHMLKRVDEIEAALDAELSDVRDLPFIVFHDAYHYFEEHFGLNAVGSITVSPEIQPGAQRVREIQARIAETGAVCVFAEPQFEPRLLETVTEGTDLGQGVLDPLGANIEAGAELYFELLDALAHDLVECLGKV